MGFSGRFNKEAHMKTVNWGSYASRIQKFFAGPFVKTGEVRTKGRTLTLYEGGGKRVLVARKTIFRRGKPVAQMVTGWKAV